MSQPTSTTATAIVYSSTHCTYCKQLKQYLTDQGVAYEERNIDDNEQNARELQALGMSSVPVTVIGGMTILGMNPTRIKKALQTLAG
ncbi:MAG: glutaredoxin family protein [Paenibacillaceae bacterium]|nr:glutaredoxin family protein [Paenibacillaceae bacterium]